MSAWEEQIFGNSANLLAKFLRNALVVLMKKAAANILQQPFLFSYGATSFIGGGLRKSG